MPGSNKSDIISQLIQTQKLVHKKIYGFDFVKQKTTLHDYYSSISKGLARRFPKNKNIHLLVDAIIDVESFEGSIREENSKYYLLDLNQLEIELPDNILELIEELDQEFIQNLLNVDMQSLSLQQRKLVTVYTPPEQASAKTADTASVACDQPMLLTPTTEQDPYADLEFEANRNGFVINKLEARFADYFFQLHPKYLKLNKIYFSEDISAHNKFQRKYNISKVDFFQLVKAYQGILANFCHDHKLNFDSVKQSIKHSFSKTPDDDILALKNKTHYGNNAVFNEGAMGQLKYGFLIKTKEKFLVKTELLNEVMTSEQKQIEAEANSIAIGPSLQFSRKLPNYRSVKSKASDIKNYLIMDIVDGYNLEVYKQNILWQQITLEDLHLIAINSVKFIINIHAKGLLHCDIKDANVILKDNMKVVFVDYGFALRLTPGQSSIELKTKENNPHARGTPVYCAPEVYNSGIYSRQSDFYALGVFLAALGYIDADVRNKLLSHPFAKSPEYQQSLKLVLYHKPFTPFIRTSIFLPLLHQDVNMRPNDLNMVLAELIADLRKLPNLSKASQDIIAQYDVSWQKLMFIKNAKAKAKAKTKATTKAESTDLLEQTAPYLPAYTQVATVEMEAAEKERSDKSKNLVKIGSVETSANTVLKPF